MTWHWHRHMAAASEMTLEQLLFARDKALYQAK